METRDDLNLPSSLRMPLRDMARGMAGIANFGEQAVRNAPAILPQPLEKSVRLAIKELEAAATRILKTNLTQGEIVSAARFVVCDGSDASCFVRVLAFGWEQLRSSRGKTRELFSETVAATRLAIDGRSAGHDTGLLHACGLLDLLRRSGAIGMPPGLPKHRSAAEQSEIDVNLFAVVLWLVAVRPETLAAEQGLLELSAILTDVHRDSVVGAMGDRQALAFQLASLSEQL